MKILAEDDVGALLSVVGIVDRASALTAELAATSMKADLVARTATGIVHVEFVKDPTPDLDLRMVDYRLRLRRRHRTTAIAQYVLALRDVPVPARYTDVDDGQLGCTWQVVRISDLDPHSLLATPTTAAIAALANGTEAERAAVLVAAAELISTHTDPDRRNVLLGAAATLASIVLPRRTISTALKEAAMPVPVRDTPLGRELYDEGRQEGRQEGDRQAVLRLTRSMLRSRFDTDHTRIESAAARLVALTDDERVARILAASSIDELDR